MPIETGKIAIGDRLLIHTTKEHFLPVDGDELPELIWIMGTVESHLQPPDPTVKGMFRVRLDDDRYQMVDDEMKNWRWPKN